MAANIMSLPQLIGLKCVSCERSISSIAEGSFCSGCGNPAHHACQHAGETGLREGRCARCGGDPSQADPEVRKHFGLTTDGPNAMQCLRCKADLEYVGTKALHEGSWWTFVSKEKFDVFVCKRCGRVELFVKGIGEELRPH